jgi:UDP-GlcNAc:undecaprenyl-phosphate GlcNAc-1-phosphate transferase
VALYFSLIIAMFVTMALIPPLMRTAERFQFVDIPNERKVHTGAIPRVGGIAMVTGAVLPIILWLSASQPVVALLIGCGIILAFGTWDDRNDLDYRIKFLGQFLAIGVVVFYGGVRVESTPFAGIDPSALYISIPLTIFFLLGVTNAINLSDGLDGLAGGTSLLTLGMIAVLGYMAGDGTVVLIALAIVGSILGFLRFNTHPARIFMGDGGSQFLGFSVAVLAIMLTQNPEAAYSPALPLLLLGLPILDTVVVMTQRIAEKRSPFSADKNHLHHRLLRLGLDHYEAVSAIYITQAFFVLLAYYLRFESDLLVVFVYGAFSLGIVGFLYLAEKSHWRVRGADDTASGKIDSPVGKPAAISSRLRRRLWRGAALSVTATLFLYFLAGAFFTEQVYLDIAVLAAAIAGLLVVSIVRNWHSPLNWLERACLYVVGTYLVYLIQVAPGNLESYEFHTAAYFLILTIGLLVGLRFSTHRQFEITTLDFLVIFIAFVVPSIPGSFFNNAQVGELIAKLIVMFYAIELVLVFLDRHWNILRFFMLGLLGVLGLRGMM